MIEHRRGVLVARASLVLAAVLWSSGSFFTRLLKTPTGLGLEEPLLTPLQIAVWRGFFAGLFLIPLLKRAEIRFNPRMVPMVLCFTAMCGVYLSALSLGSAANAIFLQNTAPVWVYFLGVYLLGHPNEKGALSATLLALVGALVIVLGNWPWYESAAQQAHEIPILLMGLASGLTYAGVVLFLGTLKNESSAWLMVLNLLGSVVGLSIYIAIRFGPSEFEQWLFSPTARQFVCLAIFGVVQMAIPYWLFARSLRKVSPQEAGIITLLEPILNPVWAYMIDPEKETPTSWTRLGGFVLLLALAWRYLPRK
jgi:drug/metabolite transporter, DME family